MCPGGLLCAVFKNMDFLICSNFSNISDDKIDNVIKNFISRHGSTTGEPFMSGYFHSLGLHVQRNRIRAAINGVDHRNTALRWGALVSRRRYRKWRRKWRTF